MNRMAVARELVAVARLLEAGIPQTVEEKRKVVRNVAAHRHMDLTAWMSDDEIEDILSRIPDRAFLSEYSKVKSIAGSPF